MLKPRHQGSCTSKFQSRKYLDLVRRPVGSRTMIGNDGSIARGLGTENTNCATGWPTRRLTVKTEDDWSTGFARCTTNASNAAVAELRRRPHRPACGATGIGRKDGGSAIKRGIEP